MVDHDVIAVCRVGVTLFIRRQKQIEHPLLDLRPFSNSAFTVGVLMTMLGLLFVFAMNVTIPLFLQGAHGTAPMGASLTLAPGILLTVVMGPIAGRLFDRHGGRWSIPLGFLTMAVFVTLVGMAAGQSSIVMFGLLYVPAALATAFVIGPSQTFALSSPSPETSPHGVTVISTSFQIAGCVGTSLATGISGAPIAHPDGSLAGFLSDGDVMRYLSANHPSSTSIYTYLVDAGEDVDRAMPDLADVNVLRLATREVITIDVNAAIADAVAILSDTRLKKVPVLDSDDPRPVGIVSRSAINRLVIAGYLREREDTMTATKTPVTV